ncbi:alpha/beta fold hydrolase [Chelatococcus reniformis]|uniref:Hydrolase n=1 Tax=Chelatococcus reniformis TaxID=1494448 RepID=A0A916XPK3_9HYPH|nr:alpha/beta hydrolase [Chelatococcus reniformis]GGC92720.1 hydrolase [Chelatococcus reniformis]
MRLAEWWDGGDFVEVDGARIFTRIDGAGERTVVFLHGFPTSSHDWSAVVEQLRGRYRCVSFDYLGYGASAKPPDADYSALIQTDRALAILSALGVAQAQVVAHDLGGILLQELLHRHEEGRLAFTLQQAIFMNSSVFPALYRPTPAQQALVDPVQGPPLARALTRESLAASLAPLFPSRRLSDAEVDDLWTSVQHEGGQLLWPKHLVYMAERARLAAPWEAALAQTRVPLGFLYGLADPISGGAIVERAAAVLPHATTAGLPGLGHFPQVERPDDVADGLAKLLG